MSVLSLISSVIRNDQYPYTKLVTAPHHCGMLVLRLNPIWNQQMIYELPNINISIETTDGCKLNSFNVDMTTVNNTNKISSIEPYSIPIYDLPSTFYFCVTPLFDKFALSAHNETVETGIRNTDDTLWVNETESFGVDILFDNSNIKSGDTSGGGGGSSKASEILYDPTGTSLTSTNVQDALNELSERVGGPVTIPLTLYASNWNQNTYRCNDNHIKSDSIVYLSTPTTLTSTQYNALGLANICPKSQSSGYIELEAFGTVPDINIPIILIIESSG